MPGERHGGVPGANPSRRRQGRVRHVPPRCGVRIGPADPEAAKVRAGGSLRARDAQHAGEVLAIGRPVEYQGGRLVGEDRPRGFRLQVIGQEGVASAGSTVEVKDPVAAGMPPHGEVRRHVADMVASRFEQLHRRLAARLVPQPAGIDDRDLDEELARRVRIDPVAQQAPDCSLGRLRTGAIDLGAGRREDQPTPRRRPQGRARGEDVRTGLEDLLEPAPALVRDEDALVAMLKADGIGPRGELDRAVLPHRIAAGQEKDKSQQDQGAPPGSPKTARPNCAAMI